MEELCKVLKKSVENNSKI